MIGSAVFLGTLILVGASQGRHQRAEDIVNQTKEVIQKLKKEADSAPQNFNASGMYVSLDRVGKQEEGSFDVAGYSSKQEEFAKFVKTAREKVSLAESSTGSERAGALNASKAAEQDMEATGAELTQIEKKFHDKLQRALDAKVSPADKAAHEFERNASHHAHAAHKFMDPLYGMGDDAEDQADRLNDEANDPYSKIAKVVRLYRRAIAEHAQAVQRRVERKLFTPLDPEERIATEREVRRKVKHASSQGSSSQSLAIFGDSKMVTTFVTAAAVGAFIASMSLVLRKNQRTAGEDDFLLLEA